MFSYMNSMIFNCPLMITQGKLDEILGFLTARMGLNAGLERKFTSASSPGPRLESDIAIIPVFGTLTHRGLNISSSGLTSYGDIRGAFNEALEDKAIKSILLDIDSNGGEMAGLFSLADEIYNARGRKPVYAVANEADENQGLKYTPIYRGSKKMELNPHYPISDEAVKDVQVKVDQVYDLFVSTVARNRGISTDMVKGTEAGMFLGTTAVEAGLADAVMDFNEVLSNAKGGNMMYSTVSSTRRAEVEVSPLLADATQRAELYHAAKGEGVAMLHQEETSPLLKNAMERAGKSQVENPLLENARRRTIIA